MGDVMSDEEIDRRGAALDEVLDRHLGPGDDSDGWGVSDGCGVVIMVFAEVEHLGAMNPVAERKKLLKVQQLARDFSQALKELHVHTAGELLTQCSDLRDLSSKNGRNVLLRLQQVCPDDFDFWVYFWATAFVLDEVMDKITPAIIDFVGTAPVAGRRNLTNVMAIEQLRDVWEERKKTPAPMNITDAGPFTDFIVEAFEALGIEGNPRAAMDSWREYRAKHPEKRLAPYTELVPKKTE
jgi:hypothetical protein